MVIAHQVALYSGDKLSIASATIAFSYSIAALFMSLFAFLISDEYAKEEIIAELSASIICDHLRIVEGISNASLRYIGSYLSDLKPNDRLPYLLKAYDEARLRSEIILRQMAD